MGRNKKYATPEEARLANLERVKQFQREHKEERKEYNKRYYQQHRDELIEKAKRRKQPPQVPQYLLQPQNVVRFDTPIHIVILQD